MLELHAALEVAAGPLVEDIDRLTHEDSLAGLAEVKAAQVQLTQRLLEGGVPAPEIQALTPTSTTTSTVACSGCW